MASGEHGHTYRFLNTVREGPVEHVVLNRPQVRNAFGPELIAELTSWAAAIAASRTSPRWTNSAARSSSVVGHQRRPEASNRARWRRR